MTIVAFRAEPRQAPSPPAGMSRRGRPPAPPPPPPAERRSAGAGAHIILC